MSRVRSCLSLVFLFACTAADTRVDQAPAGSASRAPLGELTLAQVQKEIAAQGAAWQAASTPVSGLSKQQRLFKLGAELEDVAAEHQVAALESDTPAQWDWRNKDGVNYVSPVLDQAQCGSCVAFASIGTFETVLNIAANDPSSPWQLSPQHLFSCGGGSCDFGWFTAAGARALVSQGAPDNACMPYKSAGGEDQACASACSNVNQRIMKAKSYRAVGDSIESVKKALQTGPLLASMTVYDDFMFYQSGVYKHVTGDRAGGHAVSIVGWNDEHQSWICRNSWGNTWGEHGFFEIAWGDDSGVGEVTYQLEANPVGAYVAIDGLRDGFVMSGSQAFAFDVQNFDGAAAWALYRNGQRVGEGSASQPIDTTKFEDGAYELQPLANNGATEVSGPTHSVYVLNGRETATVKFVGLTDGGTIRGKVPYSLQISASPIPLGRLHRTYSDAAGNVLIERFSENPSPEMKFSWDTTTRPNGVYTIAVTPMVGTQVLPTVSVTVTIAN